MTNRGEVTNSLPTFYLATQGPGPNASIRPSAGLQMSNSPYMTMPSPHHHQPLGQAFSLQPYAAYPHGVIYQPVVVPPMLFQPSLGMMMSASPVQQTSRNRPAPHHDVISRNDCIIKGKEL